MNPCMLYNVKTYFNKWFVQVLTIASGEDDRIHFYLLLDYNNIYTMKTLLR